jgi:ribosomal protein L34
VGLGSPRPSIEDPGFQEPRAMKTNIRNTSVKREKRGFRYRMKTRDGQKIVNARRRLKRKQVGFKKLRKYR